MSLGAVSYGIAAIGFAAMTLVLLPATFRSPRAYWLVAAGSGTVVWAVVIALGLQRQNLPLIWVYGVELARDGLWLAAMVALAKSAVPRFLIWIVGSAWLGLLILGLGWPLLRRIGVPIDSPGESLLVRAGLLMSLLGLVLLEQILRNTPGAVRRQLTYFVLGIGGLYAYDLFLYSQAELLHVLDADAWSARGIVCAALSPIIVLAVRRNPEWPLEIFVSRQVVFYSGAILSIGLYLLLMSFGGFYVREFGGEWGRIGQLLFFTGAVILLVTLVFSVALRRHARVFIEKHFFKNKYDYRVEWLRFIGTMSSNNEADVCRRSLHAVTQIIGCPGGVLFLEDDAEKQVTPVAAWPMQLQAFVDLTELSRDDSLYVFLRHRQWVVDLAEYRVYPERYGALELSEWMSKLPSARIVSPLLELDRLIGFVVLFEPPPPFELTFEDRDLLKTVGRHIATQIMQQRTDRKLAQSRQFEAYNQLTAFMMHDLKNSVAQLRLIVTNAARHKHNPEFIDDSIATVANAAERMTRLIDQLRNDSQQSIPRRVDLCELAAMAVKRCADRVPAPTLAAATESVFVSADRERLQSVIEHVIRNAQDATPRDGQIGIVLKIDAERAQLLVSDSGRGMDPQFVRDRLFKPFDSTKGSKGMGIGAYQVREYMRSLGGDVEVRSSPGTGTVFGLTFRRLTGDPAMVGSTA